MRISEADILFVPDSSADDPDDWISRWLSWLPSGRRIRADNDDVASVARALAAAIEQTGSDEAPRPVFLVGHGAGAHAIVHAARACDVSRVRGAFLVNPSAAGTQPAPSRDPLPFPCVVVASRDDPHATFEDMQNLGLDWGADVVDGGAIGRVDGGSGHGPWPEGLMRMGAFLGRL